MVLYCSQDTIVSSPSLRTLVTMTLMTFYITMSSVLNLAYSSRLESQPFLSHNPVYYHRLFCSTTLILACKSTIRLGFLYREQTSALTIDMVDGQVNPLVYA